MIPSLFCEQLTATPTVIGSTTPTPAPSGGSTTTGGGGTATPVPTGMK